MGIDLGRERVPDGPTLLKFRRLLEKHELGQALFAKVGEVLQVRGLKLGTGTIVNTTIIGAPSSTKNAEKARDPEMHQTRKGRQRYFGMKMHIGVDSRAGLAHSAVVTAANVHDKHPLPDLLHGNEQRVYGDSAYASEKALIESKAPQARDFTNQRVRRGDQIDEAERSKNRNKSKVRARVEHVFAVVVHQGALPRAGQERHAIVPGAGSGQHLPGAPAPRGMSAPAMGASGACGAEWWRLAPNSDHFGHEPAMRNHRTPSC